jgi:hypothetical protein
MSKDTIGLQGPLLSEATKSFYGILELYLGTGIHLR